MVFSTQKIDDSNTDPAPGLKPWRVFGSRVVRLTKFHPELSMRLLFAPTAAFHAYVIFLHLHDERKDDAGTAKRLYETDPRKLLKECLPQADRRLFTILKRCGGVAQPAIFYEYLVSLMDYPEISACLLDSDAINDDTLKFFRWSIKLKLDPLVVPARHGLHHNIKRAICFHDIVQVCRSLEILHDDAVEIASFKKSKKSHKLQLRRRSRPVKIVTCVMLRS